MHYWPLSSVLSPFGGERKFIDAVLLLNAWVAGDISSAKRLGLAA